MKASIKWLSDFIDLSGFEPTVIADKLTMAGVEVGEVKLVGDPNIVVGRIDAIDEHPKADRLVMCRVDVGDGRLRNIACGAKNMKAGDVVPVALPGAKPPALDFEIVERKVVGVVSEGMLCAEEELGLAEKSEGLWILPTDLAIGTPIFRALGLDDAVLDIDLTPNRPDCLSHYGLAIELGAVLGLPVGSPNWEPHTEHSPLGDVASLDVQDLGCPRYAMAVIEDIVVGPSPDWLKNRLAAVGVRSINNIVDVTNYVLMHVGQPLHAFDLDKLEGGVVVRRAVEGESMEGIDHKSYRVGEGDLVIADDKGPIAIAGVMGGKRTEVCESTTRILIECANFDPTLVRKTSKRLGLHTESSHRFERGTDPNAVGRNLELAIDLMMKAHQGLEAAPRLRSGRVDHYPEPIESIVVELPYTLPRRILGLELDAEQIAAYLTSLGLEVVQGDDAFAVTVPTRRPDITRPIDLVEEIVRMYGFDNLEPTMALVTMGQQHAQQVEPGHPPTIVPRSVREDVKRMRHILLGDGFFEAVNYSFMSENDVEGLGLDALDPRRDAHAIANPLTQDQRLMRTTLVPGLLNTLTTNIAHRLSDVAIFEMGRVYPKAGERQHLGMLVTGRRVAHFTSRDNWSFFDAKGLVESLANPFDVAQAVWQVPDAIEPYLHPGVQAEWVCDGDRLAIVGQVHPALTKDYDLAASVIVVELNLDALIQLGKKQGRHGSMPKFPAVTRDYALIYDRDARYSDLRVAIDSLAREDSEFGDLLESVELFDVYTGAQVPEGKRSLALSVVYRSADRTLTEDEIGSADQKLLSWLEKSVGTELR